ncbi:hypothetical protein BU23DRAFT_493862 [Bimuria novae-zelandiae CBS 107.79]|uniref:TMEM205-like domain-containing protein n=1 Tax=Bimuria novae-zelandiae CBS 107.79 TaxID=1447943 RepID=A0A6A5UJE9_9PLEO|nr:hypothetical protein BU23DRAFT_493862 [Bimuria novae-zelandiae CBS 107.79]
MLSTILIPAHLLAYSTLLGTQLYQSFVAVKVAYQALPSDAFTMLQKRAFPVYFRTQSALIVLSALTFPPHGPAALIKNRGDWIPFLVAGVMAGFNLVVYGPRTSRLMMIRRFQGKRTASARQGDGAAEQRNDKTKCVDRAFSRNHAMSIHLNLITIGATLWYGWRLAWRLDVRLG